MRLDDNIFSKYATKAKVTNNFVLGVGTHEKKTELMKKEEVPVPVRGS